MLSFDSFMGSIGGAVAQPALGRVSDVYGYGPAYVVSGVIQAFAIPFVAPRPAAECRVGPDRAGASAERRQGPKARAVR